MTSNLVIGKIAVVASIVGFTGAAAAADWSGFYAGAYGESATVDIVHDYDLDVEFGYTATGMGGGLLVGYNVQSGNIVYGLEADINFGGATGSGLCDGGTTPSCAGSGSEPAFTLDQVMALSMRVGVVSGDLLYYGAVGVSQADVTVIDTLQPATVEETHSGYVAALGVEWMMQDNLSVGAEYQYGTYETLSYPLVTSPDEVGFETGSIKVSVKYRF